MPRTRPPYSWEFREGALDLLRGGSFVSLLAWEGRTMLDVARQAGHSVEICDRHYAGIFDPRPC